MALEKKKLPKVAAAPALTALTALVTAARAEPFGKGLLKMLKIPWTPENGWYCNMSENIELASWKHLEALFYLGECYTAIHDSQEAGKFPVLHPSIYPI